MSLARDSSNLLLCDVVVNYNDLAPDHKTPTPVVGATVTAQVYALDRTTAIGPPVSLAIEPDQPPNYYRGILPSTVDFGDNDEVYVKYTVDGGNVYAKRVKWTVEKVTDE